MDSVCPHLGLMNDPKTSTFYPTHCNACFQSKPPYPIKLDYQRTVCLTAKHLDCEGFIKGWESGLPKKFRNKKCNKKQLGASMFWTIAGILLSIIMLLGLIFVLNNLEPAPIATLEGDIEGVTATMTDQDLLTPEVLITTAAAPTSTATPPPEPGATPTFTTGPALQTPFGDSGGNRGAQFLIYEVLAGDSLQLIANLFNTTPEVLSAINVREPLSLWPGDFLVVCVGCTDPEGLPQLTARYLEDMITLTQLAEECDCPIEDLSRWNGLGEGEQVLAERWVVLPAE